MSQDRPLPGSAEDWLTRAEGDLVLARAPLPEGAFYEDLCFHAQQAAEKSLKAVYQHFGKRFRYTHELNELRPAAASLLYPPTLSAFSPTTQPPS